MRDPVRLSCQHCFCLTCLSGKEVCPVCEDPFPASKICVDRVLSYVIESSREQSDKCANCDQISQPMNFCETCQQPLCNQCVSITHSAKFFASHHISPLEERGRMRGQLNCTEHNGGPFVLYCQEARKLMCIECFNASSLERRNNFVNIDSAHKICRDKLDKNVIRLRNFQNELNEQTDVRKRLLSETEARFLETEEEVVSKYNSLVAILTAKKDEILEEVRVKREKQDLQLRRQLRALANMEGPIRLNLLSASVFCSYASHLDLLHCYSELSKNINAVMTYKMDKISCDTSPTNYVDRLLSALDLKSPESNKENSSPFPLIPPELWRNEDISSEMESNGSRSLSPLNHNGVVSSFLIDTNTTLFDENFQKIDNPLKQFSEESSLISKKLLDLQRDITSRRCVIDKNEMEKLFEHCETLERELSAHNTLIQQIKPHLAEVWNAQLDSIRKQQLLVQNRLNELSTLHRFIQQVLATGHKLKPLSNFLTSVISAVDNRRSGLVGPSPMEQICMEILTILPNSDQRVNAIEKEEEQRRQAREAEKIVAEKEARALKKNLKETRRNRQRPISMIVVEQSRDRDDAAAISPGLSLKRQPRVKRSSQSDESSGLNSPSPRILSSTASLDVTDLASSPTSLSPTPNERSESAADIREKPPPPKLLPIPSASNAPTPETVNARNLLIQSIKEKVKRID